MGDWTYTHIILFSTRVAIFDATLGIRWPTGQQKLSNEELRIEYKMVLLNIATIQHHWIQMRSTEYQ